eukprot:evm.model.scf_390.1 EVM.evm.TU.scf_390.1   scf_390:26673-35480(-)
MVLFATPEVAPLVSILVEKPTTFGVANTTKVSFKCPPEGTVFDIRSPSVHLSDVSFSRCDLSSGMPPVTVSGCETGWGPIHLTRTEFVGNLGAGLVAASSGLGECRLIVKNSVFLHNSLSSITDFDLAVIKMVSGGRLEIESSLFQGNRRRLDDPLEDAAFESNVIYADKATVVLSHCQFTDNSLDHAVQVNVKTNATLENCVFANNGQDLEEELIFGGAVAAQGEKGVMVMRHCSFLHNRAGTGGALDISGTEVQLENCTFYHNAAFQEGGAIEARENTTLNASTCTFSYNDAIYGGGLAVVGGKGLDVKDCIFENNTAGQAGAAIFVLKPDSEDERLSIMLHRARFFNNTVVIPATDLESQGNAPSIGGALFMGPEALLPRLYNHGRPFSRGRGKVTCEVTESTFLENRASMGGAVASVHVQLLQMDSVDFVRNEGLQGGALHIESNGDVDQRQYAMPENYCNGLNTTFRGNVAGQQGGALFVRINRGPGVTTLERSGISPVGISSILETAPRRKVDTPINNNEDDVFFERSSFVDSSAALSGGAWHVEGGRVGCRDCTFERNRADQESEGVGGCISLKPESAFHGRNVSLVKCAAAGDGGALYSEGSVVDTVGGRIEGNSAGGNGGGMCIVIPKGVRFFENIFSRINATIFADNAAEAG